MVTVREWWEYRLFRFGEKNDHGAECADVAGGDGGGRCGLSGFVPCWEDEKADGRTDRAAGILSGGDRYLHAGAPDSETGV